VRVNPTEVHISGPPEYYDTIYSATARYDKLKKFEPRFTTILASQSTAEDHVHRPRRAALNPFFSKKQISNYAPYLQSLADKLCDRVTKQYKGTGKVFPVDDAWACFAADVVTEYVFGWSYDYLDAPDFKTPFTQAVKSLGESAKIMAHFSLIIPLLLSLPDSFVGFIMPDALVIFKFKRVRLYIPAAMHNVADGEQEMRSQILRIMNGKYDSQQNAEHPTLFYELFKSDLPPHERSLERLEHEGQSIVGAGVETTRYTLSLATFHILNNPIVYKRLQDELFKAIPDPTSFPSLSELERLPYLTGVIQEGEFFQTSKAHSCPLTIIKLYDSLTA
jgi:cytochrome P450